VPIRHRSISLVVPLEAIGAEALATIRCRL